MIEITTAIDLTAKELKAIKQIKEKKTVTATKITNVEKHIDKTESLQPTEKKIDNVENKVYKYI